MAITHDFHDSSRCLNCRQLLNRGNQFCGHCGQDIHTHRFNGKHIFHELTHAFTHADKNIFVLIWQLFYRPGKIAGQYVAGQRKKYFNPITYLVLVVGISSLIMYSSGFVNFESGMGKNAFSNFLNKHTNLIIFLNIPILAFFNRMLFRKAGYNYWEHLIFVCFVSAQRSLFFSVVVAPLHLLIPGAHNIILSVYLVIWMLYFAFADTQFLGKKTIGSIMKCVLVPVLNQLVMIIIVTGAIIIYRVVF